jgi:hypothetical protein
MLNRANLKGAATMASPAISFPPNTAQRWTLANGLTLIVQEDRSAPVASVQAWCATGSTTEDKHLGAGLSHILEHLLFKGTKTRSTNEIAQKSRTSAVTSTPILHSIALFSGSMCRRMAR